MIQTTKVAHRTVKVRDLDIFYREAGPKDARRYSCHVWAANAYRSQTRATDTVHSSRVIISPISSISAHRQATFSGESGEFGNQHRAALLLGIARKTLRTKLRELGLRLAHSVEADEDDLP